MGLRISESVRIGPFRFRLSVPLGRGRTWLSAGTRTGRGWTSVSAPLWKIAARAEEPVSDRIGLHPDYSRLLDAQDGKCAECGIKPYKDAERRHSSRVDRGEPQ